MEFHWAFSPIHALTWADTFPVSPYELRTKFRLGGGLIEGIYRVEGVTIQG